MPTTKSKKDARDGQSNDQQLQGNQESLRMGHRVDDLTYPSPIIKPARGKSKTFRRSFKRMLEHQLQLLLIAIVALMDYLITPHLNKLPLPIGVLVQVFFFGLCFAYICDVSEECLKRAAKLGANLHRDPNLALVCQIWRKGRTISHQNQDK
jgi:hypothetical protein